MKRGLTSKVFIIHNIFIAIIIFIFIINLRSLVSERYYKEKKKEYSEQSKVIEQVVYQYHRGEIKLEEAREKINYAEMLSRSMINIVDEKAFLDKELSSVDINYKLTQEEFSNLDTEDFITIKIEDEEVGKLEVEVCVIPIFQDGKLNGAIVFNQFTDNIMKHVDFAVNVFVVFGLFLIIASNYFCYKFLKKYILKKVEKINTEARLIVDGHREKRIDVEDGLVIKEMAESINFMAADLQRIENERKELVSNISHELKTPITSIKGFVEAMIDGIIPKERESHYLWIISNEIGRLTRLIDNLLDLSFYESNRKTLNLETFDIKLVIQQVVSIKENDIKEKNIFIDMNFEEQLGIVLADRDKVYQVIVNILDNSVKFVPNYGTIKICIETFQDRLKISIYNSGPHIQKENLSKIWDRFFREEKLKGKKKGSGLGLAIVKNIIDLHEEKIWAENIGESGVRFNFTLKKAKE